MKAIRPLLLSFLCWTLTLASAQNNSNTSPNVLEAINICREKLKVDPHFPKIQHSLAQLLDSRISNHADVDSELVEEVLQLYHEVGQPSSQVEEKRLPPAKVRFESLTRAGTIAKDVLHDIPGAAKYFSLAINLDGVEDSSLLLAFETIMPDMISWLNFDNQVEEVVISVEGTLSDDASVEHKMTQLALDMCKVVEAQCPTETIVDEYRGAIFRRARHPELAYQSYYQARVKAKQNLLGGKGFNQNTNEHVDLVADFVRTSTLAAASAREAGHGLHQQMTFLTVAEKYAAPLLLSMSENEDMEHHIKDSFRGQMVDLYNNMGIAEKKQGSLERARDFFSKALEINPTDGHALVQLASVSDGTDADDIVSTVKELDADYVSALFDGYSSRFESELVDILQYQGHLMVYDALQEALKQLGQSPLSIKKVVDLGCGTGLLGEIIANEMPWVEVNGVDLSQRMVEISRSRESKRGRKVYASLSNEDAATYLAKLEAESIECILASDVFIYIGDISKVLQESWKCLGSNGLVGFTVESHHAGLRLLPSGRFGHSRAYISEVAKSEGFEVISWEDSILRQQRGDDVKGAAVVLRKLRKDLI